MGLREDLEQRGRDELDWFKQHVDLSAVAEKVGYRIDPKDSSQKVTIVRRDSDNDKLMVGIREGGYCYRSSHQPDDRGSVIDFLQSRLGLNLFEVRKWLRDWRQSPFAQSTKLPSRSSHAVNPDRNKAKAVWDAATWEPDCQYLQLRGLTESLRNPCFQDSFRTDKKGNAIFPYYDKQGLCGYEYRNIELKRMGKDSVRGLWYTKNLFKNTRSIVLCESPIDCMSHSELYGWPVAYVATGGQISSLQRELLTGLFDKVNSNHGRVIIGIDNDPSGELFYQQCQGLCSFKLNKHIPVDKDFNADLQYCLKEVS